MASLFVPMHPNARSTNPNRIILRQRCKGFQRRAYRRRNTSSLGRVNERIPKTPICNIRK